jgi:DNA primase
MDQLEEIKNKIDIVPFISEYLPLKKAGRNFRALCPFHTEKTPSFIVSPERQIWHCFGCQKGGDVFGFLMAIDNLEFPEALEVLAKRAGVKLVKSYEVSEQSKVKAKIYQMNHLASEFYQYLLLNHSSGKRALDYVLGRGVKRETIKTFSLGWAPNLWDALTKFLVKKGFSLADLETGGLLVKRERSSFDRFRNRLIFTLRDQRGNVVGFAGRILDQAASEAKYINTPETPVYVKGNILYGLDVTSQAIKKEGKAVIVEGEFDLISSFQAGQSNVVAIKGSALTEGQVGLLKRYTQNIILALDTDLAGDEAARRGVEIADAAGFSISVVKLAVGKDPDECVRIDSSLWKKSVKEALPVFDYFLDLALSRHGTQTAEAKKKIGDEVLPILVRITNPIVQAHYLGKLAQALSVPEEAIAATAQKIVRERQASPGPLEKFSPSQFSREQLLQELLLAMVLQSENLKKTLTRLEEEQSNLDDLLSRPIKRIFVKLNEFLAVNKKFAINDFLKTLPAELVPICDRAYLEDLGRILQEEKVFSRELDKVLAEIKKILYRKRLLSLAEKMKKAKTSELDLIKEEYRKISAELKKTEAVSMV